eukprot:2242853-Rhodomonas_salina.1
MEGHGGVRIGSIVRSATSGGGVQRSGVSCKQQSALADRSRSGPGGGSVLSSQHSALSTQHSVAFVTDQSAVSSHQTSGHVGPEYGDWELTPAKSNLKVPGRRRFRGGERGVQMEFRMVMKSRSILLDRDNKGNKFEAPN